MYNDNKLENLKENVQVYLFVFRIILHNVIEINQSLTNQGV